jgi:hypothetical protein
LHEKRAVKGIHSPKNQKSLINKQNSPRIDVCLDGTRGFGSPWSVIVGGGGVNLYFIAWEPLLMCLAWKILIADGHKVNKKGAFPKISFISVLKT